MRSLLKAVRRTATSHFDNLLSVTCEMRRDERCRPRRHAVHDLEAIVVENGLRKAVVVLQTFEAS